MSDIQPIDPQELFNTFTDPGQVDESTRRPTVPSGTYVFKAQSADARVTPADWRNPGRKSLNIRATLEQEGQVRGSLFVEASWQVIRTPGGKLDRESRLWGHIVEAFDAKEKSVGDVVEMLKNYPLTAQVQELFNIGQTDDGQNMWRQAKSAEERKEYLTKGYEVINSVSSLRKMR